MTKCWYLILVFFSPNFAWGQQVIITGKVLNESDNSGVHVLNRTTNYNTITNQNGEFSIAVSLQDTLYLSSIRYDLKEVIINTQIFNSKVLHIEMSDRVNQLDEVIVGNQLTGDLSADLKGIAVKDNFNFDDVGIPGFIGTPEEKIYPIVPGIGSFTSVDIEALYKHLSGYYKKLRLKRKWIKQNNTAAQLIAFYTVDFFTEAYNIPENRLYDFMLYCIETTNVQDDFLGQNYAGVLHSLESASGIYTQRLKNSKD